MAELLQRITAEKNAFRAGRPMAISDLSAGLQRDLHKIVPSGTRVWSNDELVRDFLSFYQ
ncbi:MAG: hypothetical protein U9M92_03160 [Patescibacteria group bacterium]|nr:hypothetical protein [Patescibacteria group bacterium]